jgi:hypothetical protein
MFFDSPALWGNLTDGAGVSVLKASTIDGYN